MVISDCFEVEVVVVIGAMLVTYFQEWCAVGDHTGYVRAAGKPKKRKEKQGINQKENVEYSIYLYTPSIAVWVSTHDVQQEDTYFCTAKPPMQRAPNGRRVYGVSSLATSRNTYECTLYASSSRL